VTGDPPGDPTGDGGSVQVERTIAAPPDVVWRLVADVTQMGRWSPETESCRWIGRSTGPSAGARFRGRNRNGKKSWSTASTVTDAEPGRRFAFEVKVGPFRVARWEYRCQPSGAGCLVTETYTDQRGRLVTALGGPVSGVADRAAHNRATMATTLERLAVAAEAADDRSEA
jgi:uncharacterized protein YndB with AHSA1/START domain